MKSRANKVFGALVVILAVVWVVDWQMSKGGVVTKDEVTLIEDDRLRFGTEAVAGYGLSGKLAVLPGGCVGITEFIDDSQVGVPVIWNHGTELVSGDPLRVRFGGQTYSEGDAISGGSKGAWTAKEESFFDQIPDSCKAKKYDRFGADN